MNQRLGKRWAEILQSKQKNQIKVGSRPKDNISASRRNYFDDWQLSVASLRLWPWNAFANEEIGSAEGILH
jgi:hypothetical protein